jgi:hypothetical protein
VTLTAMIGLSDSARTSTSSAAIYSKTLRRISSKENPSLVKFITLTNLSNLVMQN